MNVEDNRIFSDQLLSFIKTGNNEIAKEILNDSNLYHSVDAAGATLLHHAARCGNDEITQFLLLNSSNVDTQDAMGNTPLMIAVEGNYKGVITSLISARANVFLLNHEEKSVLHLLSECTSHKQSLYICTLFYMEFHKKGLTVKERATQFIDVGFDICLAAYTLDYKIIKYMIERGYSVDSRHPVRKSTALHVAVFFADLDTVITLLEFGADAKVLDVKNASPLYYLYRSNINHYPNKLGILKKLLPISVCPTSCNAKGYFDLKYTLQFGNSEAVREILQIIPNFTAVDKIYGRTFLHYLAQNINPGVVEEFLKLNIWYDINAVDKLGLCPLYFAATHGNVDMTRFLLNKRADPNPKIHSPLYYAYTRSIPKRQDQYNQCFELLLQYGTNPQFLIVRDSGEVITIFDAALKNNDFDGMHSVMAELSIIEKLGRNISNTIRNRINSNSTFNQYFNKCRELIAEEIFASITLFKLLTSDYSTMDRYLNNTRLLQEIETFNVKHDVKSYYSYIYNKWEKHCSEAKEYQKLKHSIGEAICKILRECVDDSHFIVHNIIKYLDIHSLRQLATL